MTTFLFLFGFVYGVLMIIYIRTLKHQRDRAVADYVKLSNILIDMACTGPQDEEDKECHHQQILVLHRMKGCIETYDN